MSLMVNACGQSDVGRERSHNEDSFAVDADRGLYLVADGMGGHEHGEVASQLAVESVRRLVVEAPSPPSDAVDDVLPHTLRLQGALEEAHGELRNAIETNQDLLGMGTTIVAMWLVGDVAAIAHVGDSRAYRVVAGRLEQLTVDHSWVREQVAAGHLSEQQARQHPLRNVVTQALGGVEAVAVEVSEHPVHPGELYLLCTDGLTSMLDDDEIAACLAEGGSLEERCGELIRRANERGGLDNITVVLVELSSSQAA